MMGINYFIDVFLKKDIELQMHEHFELIYNTLRFPVYKKEYQEIICNEIEKLGFSVRCGTNFKYEFRQGMQDIVFECSKRMKFNHRYTSDIDGEICFAVNS